ncbi:MAG: hypothetical protein KKD86_16170 [Bacteroidetes bacterium]|nr:hypothetical protein [Bacteroidota bacterium]
MKNKVIFIAMVLICISTYGQKYPDSLKFEYLDKIYRNLEYNTTAFNDLKRIWNVTDPVFVREIYNRFIVENALLLDGKKPSLDMLKEKTKDIYRGEVFIELRRRYYDNEIEQLRFFTESKLKVIDSTVSQKDYFFDTIEDHIFIKSVLGEMVYEDLKSQFYAHTDLTKTLYDTKLAYNFDIYLSLLNPRLLFWTETTEQKNKYLVSALGKWGNDRIGFPGWYHSDFYVGLQVIYIDYMKNNEPYNTYLVELATGVPTKQPGLDFMKADKGKHLFHTGSNFYFRLSGNPLLFINKSCDKYVFDFEGSFSLTEFTTKDYGVSYSSKFYSNRNFFMLSGKYKDIFNVMDIGWLYAELGLGGYDVTQYLLDPRVTKLQVVKAKGNGDMNYVTDIRAGITNNSGLLAHDVALNINYNISQGYAYIGVKAFLILSNSFGFDFAFYQSLNLSSAPLPYYRNDFNLVFSPIIRINY